MDPRELREATTFGTRDVRRLETDFERHKVGDFSSRLQLDTQNPRLLQRRYIVQR